MTIKWHRCDKKKPRKDKKYTSHSETVLLLYEPDFMTMGCWFFDAKYWHPDNWLATSPSNPKKFPPLAWTYIEMPRLDLLKEKK